MSYLKMKSKCQGILFFIYFFYWFISFGVFPSQALSSGDEKSSHLISNKRPSIKHLFQPKEKEISVYISNIGDSSHIEWQGRDFWSYEIKKIDPRKISLTLPPLSQEAEKKLNLWTDHLIEKIIIKKSRNKKKIDIIFHFKKENIKFFDYIITKSSLLITDFYTEVNKKKVFSGSIKKKNPKYKMKMKSPQFNRPQDRLVGQKSRLRSKKKGVKKPEGSFKKMSKLDKKTKTRRFSSKKKSRDPAGTEFIQIKQSPYQMGEDSSYSLRKGVFDGSDPNYERFLIKPYEIKEESIIASKKNIYIKFPLLHLTTNRLPEMLSQTPEYRIKKSRSKENQEVRFLLKLFRKEKYFSFLKVYKYFIDERKKSYYDEMVRNMAMEVYLRIWIKDGDHRDYKNFKSIVSYLLKNYPRSPLTKRAHLMVAYAALTNKDALETIQSIKDFTQKYPNFVLFNELRQSMAEAYFILEKYNLALNIYRKMERETKKSKKYDETFIKSSYFIGDVYARKSQYREAVTNYKKSISHYPKYQYVFPNVFYNLAESLFWLEEYQDSLRYFVSFLKYFPSHDYGGYAMTRAGEILEILGADDEKVKGAFMESAFRFKGNPGADVARMRLMSRNMENMRGRQMDQALKEIDEISQNSKLPRVSEFVSLMVADGLYRREEYKKSLDYLTDFYYTNFSTLSFEPFKKRILRNISNLIKEQLDQENFINAIDLFQTYGFSWLRDSDRLDIPFFLAKSYELAGVDQAAQKIYEQTLSDLTRIENTEEEKERRVNENLSTKDSVYLRLASVFVKQKKYEEGFEYLKNIKTDEFLSDEERIEKVNFSATIAEEKGDVERAEAYLKTLTRSWQGSPDLLAPVYFRLARVQEKLNKHEVSDRTLDLLLQLIDQLKKNEENLSDTEKEKNRELFFHTLLAKGRVLQKQKKDISAVEIYMKVINEFENEKSLGSVRYKIGKILFEKGDVTGAEEVWERLDPERYVMYLDLAKEQLDHSDWKKDIKTYIHRSNASLAGKISGAFKSLEVENL